MSFAATEAAPESNDATFETFDNFDEIAEEAEAADDDWSKPEPEAKEKVSEDLKVIKDSQADSEGKVIKDDKKSEKGVKDDSEDGEEEESEEKEESEEESEEESKEVEEKEEDKKPKSKLRMRMGEELYNIDADATLPVKIDGKLENIPVQELVNNYSGKTAWDRKFTELGKEKKAIEFEKNQVMSEKQALTEHFQKALNPLKDKEGNPLDSLLYLVEMSGEDPYNAYRRVMEANLGEINKLLDMTEVERELYFHKKKDELYGKVAEKRQVKIQKEQSFNQLAQKVDKLRQAYNVSEEEFVEAADELENSFKESGLDPEEITEEQVVDYASLRTHIAEVKKLVEPYEDNISDGKYGDLVARLSRALRDGELDKAAITKLLKRNFSVEEEVKELNSKVYSKSQKAPAKKTLKQDSDKFESFDDWE